MVGNIRVMSPLNAHGLLLPTYLVSQGVEYTLSLRHPWRIPQGTKSQFLIKKVSFSQVAIENCRHPEGGQKKKRIVEHLNEIIWKFTILLQFLKVYL